MLEFLDKGSPSREKVGGEIVDGKEMVTRSAPTIP
jgi:hypothetical protein